MRQELHWICPAPSHYHSHLFRALADQPDLDLVIHFTMARYSAHPWKQHDLSGYTSRTMRRFAGVDWSVVRLALRDDVCLLIAGWNDPTSVIAGLLSRGRLFIWTDTPDVVTSRRWFKRTARSSVLKSLFSRAEVVFGTGRRALGILESMGAERAKLVSLPFFVPIRGREDRRTESASGTLNFCSFGRLENRIKGFHIAISAFARAREITGFENFRYVIGGVGPDEQILRDQVERLGMGRFVEFAGWLEPHEVAATLSRSHALVHPALHDPFPVVVLEAMAAGVPVLGSDVSGSVIDRIADGSNGFVHRAGDIEQLASQLALVFQEPSRLESLGAAAYATASDWPVARGVEIIRTALAG